MKSWMASMSSVTRAIRSPLRASSCSASDSRWMWWYSVSRRSCATHWLTFVVRDLLDVPADRAEDGDNSTTATTAKLRAASVWSPKTRSTAGPSQPASFFACTTLSMTILTGHGSSDVRQRLADHRNQREDQRLPVRTENRRDVQRSRLGGQSTESVTDRPGSCT